MDRGLIFNIQKYSLHDGPGIRTTVFLKGCPLSCPWCHNPESVSHCKELILVETRCVACGQCGRVCPVNPTPGRAGPLPPRPEPCFLCAACVEACPTGARQIVGRDVTVSEVIRELEADRLFYEESGGGVTLSGGEPLSQPRFLIALLQACHQRGFHTTVDTSGFTPTDELLTVATHTDLFLYDLKLMDDALHRQHTGVSNVLIHENLRTLARVHDRIWVRVPVIPGITDTVANLEAIGQFVSCLDRVRQVNLLPYHNTGLQKLRRLGRPLPCPALEPPPAEGLEQAARILARFGVQVRVGG